MGLSFNLLDEPWIRVRDKQGKAAELSLTDALVKGHCYSALAGESPAQDAAMLRLLIAVVHTVFYRFAENGDETELENEDDALDRWNALWQARAEGLPEVPIRAYLNKWRCRFDLFDEKYPFYQVPEAKIGTDFSSAKLNGAILQSGNKTRIFANRTEESRSSLSFAEAARWLLYLQGFDDASPKPKTEKGKKNNKRPEVEARSKTAWMGNLGLIYAVGSTLSETILLNLTFLTQAGKELYGRPKPCWERNEGPETEERLPIVLPDNLPELFTVQSRRILLKSDGRRVVGYNEYVGDLLDKNDAFAEPMTLWERAAEEKGTAAYFYPRQHDPARQFWRDFASFVIQSDDKRLPGVVYWLQTLEEQEDCLDKGLLRFNSVSVIYDAKKFSVSNTVNDTLSFQAALLSELGTEWRLLITKQIELCDKLAQALAILAGSLAFAAGKRELRNGSPLKNPWSLQEAEHAKSQFYFRIDAAFRQWLLLPEAGQGDVKRDEICEVWNKTAIAAAYEFGRSLVEEAGPAALTGRTVDKEYYSAAKAYNSFMFKINQLRYKKEE